jgi:hypothetical protein
MTNRLKYRVRSVIVDDIAGDPSPAIYLHDAAVSAAERTGRSYEDVRSSIALLTDRLPRTLLPPHNADGIAVRVEIVQ